MTFYKHFACKADLVRSIRDRWIEEGFRRLDEIKAMDIPFPNRIDLMTQWKVEFGQRLSAEFIRETVSADAATEELKTRYLANIRAAQLKGEVRSGTDPEFLWLVVEKLGDSVKDGSWKEASPDQSQFQRQLGTLPCYGLRAPQEDTRLY